MELTEKEFKVFDWIKFLARKDGEALVGNKFLSDKVKISEEEVRAILNSLRKKGYISGQREQQNNGQYKNRVSVIKEPTPVKDINAPCDKKVVAELNKEIKSERADNQSFGISWDSFWEDFSSRMTDEEKILNKITEQQIAQQGTDYEF